MKGKLIVLDGIDGSGKSTQFKMLTERLEREGTEFKKVIFPRYSETSASLVKSYLSGEFGKNPEDVNSYAASTFFFVDRFASYKTDWGEFYNNGGTVICDRYTTSNAIHQGSKMSCDELPKFLDWLYDFEFRLMELPKPDVVLYMDIDLETCINQMKTRQEQTNTKGDIHETHRDFLENCLKTGDFAADYLGWQRINCLKSGKMRTIDNIHADVYKTIMSAIN